MPAGRLRCRHMRPNMTFSEKVVALALAIPPGRVTTYGRLAKRAGGGGMASQSVTGILCKAESRGVKGIPWHRIVYADGRVWLDDRCRAKRLALYRKERILLDAKDRIVGFEGILL